MQFAVLWNIFVDANSDQKCRKLLSKVEQAIGIPLAEAKIEKYWKDKTRFKIQAVSRIDVPSNKDGFFTVMTKAGHLSRAWVISAPAEDLPLEFSGTSQPGSGLIPGIDSVFFEVAKADVSAPNELIRLG